MLFNKISIWSSIGPSVRWSVTICAILKDGIIGSICVKLYEIWTSDSGGVCGQQTDDLQRPITIGHLEPSAQVS